MISTKFRDATLTIGDFEPIESFFEPLTERVSLLPPEGSWIWAILVCNAFAEKSGEE